MKMIAGDVFAVPLSNRKYGLCQIVRSRTTSKWGSTITVLFDIQLTLEELSNFNYVKIYGLKIITGIPVLIHDSKKAPILLVKLVNMPIVDWDVPLFLIQNTKGNMIVGDFNMTHYRYVEDTIAQHMFREFNLIGRITIPDILSNYFNNANLDKLSKDLNWWRNSITDRDMKNNPHLYHRWENGNWEDLPNAIIALPEKSEDAIAVLTSLSPN